MPIKRPYFTVIIPYYNSQGTIARLLGTLRGSSRAPSYEVVVVDDGSQAKFRGLKLEIDKKKTRIIELSKNKGPAAARNAGVKVARGKFLLFLDSDVEVFPDTLTNLSKIYEDDPDIVAVTGVWVKDQRSRAFFPNFKALRDWSYWTNERDVHGYYFLFSTRIASIKKTVFQRIGGFDESYNAALVEDIELTYRIARRYAIIFAPQVRVRHEFEGFGPIAKKYFWRSYHWSKLFGARQKFDSVATTEKEALAALSGVILVALICISPWAFWWLPLRLLNYLVAIVLADLLLHLILVGKFLKFAWEEKGIFFALRSFVVGLILYCFIFAGALWARLE